MHSLSDPRPPTTETPLAPALTVEHLRQTYGPVAAVNDVSVTLSRGEIVGLAGHSGSGKSTLLRLIAGLEQPAGGTIAIGGRVVSGNGRFVPPEERGIGMMFQDYALFPHLSVIDNVRFGLRRLSSAEAYSTARAGLERVGLASRADAYPHALSGGEQQRVALARALAPRPQILLMDEPFSNLDRRTRDRIRDQTAAILREAGTTAIMVTHDPEDAIRMGDRIMLMQAGRIVQAGTADELYKRPASLLVARFFSDFNEIAGVCRDGMVETPLGAFPAPGIADGAAAVACIRPHDIALSPSDGAEATGTIASAVFLGDGQLATVTVPGLDRPLQMRTSPATPTTVGAKVMLRVPANSVLVFPASG